MKRKQRANLIMVLIILVIATAGVLGVGMLRGWFDDTSHAALLTEIRGIVHLERKGVSFAAESGTALRAGDRLTCTPGATARIRLEDGSSATLGANVQLEIQDAAPEHFALSLQQGELFLDWGTPAIALQLGEEALSAENTAASMSVYPNAATVSVFRGSVEDASAGDMLSWVGSERTVEPLRISTLNAFTILQLRLANARGTTCFDNMQLDALEELRRAELQPAETEPAETEPETQETSPVFLPVIPTTEPAETTAPTEGFTIPLPAIPEPQPTEAKPTQPAPAQPGFPLYCRLTIRCDTILSNWSQLDPAKAEFVPANGVILDNIRVGFNPEETVLDVLKRACEDNQIQLEYSWSPSYGGSYVEGINHLYEFDCGYLSGWMYKVDGWFPNYGCSSYPLTGGETIVWCYTCSYGSDVGG